MLNQKIIETNGISYPTGKLMTWDNWQYTDEVMEEIQRRNQYSSIDVK
jgi:hypothetical protein